MSGRDVQCSETKGTARVDISRDVHNPCDLVHDEHANHRHATPNDTQLSPMLFVTAVWYKIHVKAMPVEDALLKHYR
jgi:hypothetical protein